MGLITGLGFAQLGHKVVNVDRHAARIAQLTQGVSPIYDSIFIAVGSPRRQDGSTNLAQLRVAAPLSHRAAS